MYRFSEPLREAGAAKGTDDFLFLLYGQAAALNRTLPAAALLETLVAEAQGILRRK